MPELKGISVDSLMFVKDDLIIPHVRPDSRDWTDRDSTTRSTKCARND